MGVDRVGLALAASGLAAGLLALDDGETGCGDRAGQSESVATGALDRHTQEHRSDTHRTSTLVQVHTTARDEPAVVAAIRRLGLVLIDRQSPHLLLDTRDGSSVAAQALTGACFPRQAWT